MEEDLRGSIDIFGEILELRNYKIGSSKNPRTVDASLYWDPTLGGGSEKLRFHKGRFKTFSEKEFKSFLSKSLIFPNGRRAPATITLSDVEKPWRNDFENGPALNVFVVDPSDDPISYCNVSGPGLSHFTKKYPDPMPLRDFLDELLLLVFVRSPDSRRSTDLTFTIKVCDFLRTLCMRFDLRRYLGYPRHDDWRSLLFGNLRGGAKSFRVILET